MSGLLFNWLVLSTGKGLYLLIRYLHPLTSMITSPLSSGEGVYNLNPVPPSQRFLDLVYKSSDKEINPHSSGVQAMPRGVIDTKVILH